MLPVFSDILVSVPHNQLTGNRMIKLNKAYKHEREYCAAQIDGQSSRSLIGRKSFAERKCGSENALNAGDDDHRYSQNQAIIAKIMELVIGDNPLEEFNGKNTHDRRNDHAYDNGSDSGTADS